MGLGVITLVTFILPTARKLQGELLWISLIPLMPKETEMFILYSSADSEVACLYMILRYTYFASFIIKMCNLLRCPPNHSTALLKREESSRA
jgi:hypothetical protein